MARPTNDPKDKIVTLRLSKGERENLAAVRQKVGGTKTDAIRLALRIAAEQIKAA